MFVEIGIQPRCSSQARSVRNLLQPLPFSQRDVPGGGNRHLILLLRHRRGGATHESQRRAHSARQSGLPIPPRGRVATRPTAMLLPFKREIDNETPSASDFSHPLAVGRGGRENAPLLYDVLLVTADPGDPLTHRGGCPTTATGFESCRSSIHGNRVLPKSKLEEVYA